MHNDAVSYVRSPNSVHRLGRCMTFWHVSMKCTGVNKTTTDGCFSFRVIKTHEKWWMEMLTVMNYRYPRTEWSHHYCTCAFPAVWQVKIAALKKACLPYTAVHYIYFLFEFLVHYCQIYTMLLKVPTVEMIRVVSVACTLLSTNNPIMQFMAYHWCWN